VIVVGIMVLVFVWNPIEATSKPLGILIFLVLALVGTELLIRQTGREFPEAHAGDMRQAFRARVASVREGRHHTSTSGDPSPAAGSTTVDQLGRLADLRDRGAITPEEYESAKARLLGG
jgi:hypothetical protein